MESGIFFVYILKCCDGSLYTGWTNNVTKRLAAHNSSKASKYTRARLPVELVFTRELATKSAAMKLEYKIKSLSRKEKLLLIKNEKSRKI